MWAEWSDRSPLVLKVPGLKSNLCTEFPTFSVHPFGTRFDSELENGEGVLEERWQPASVTPLTLKQPLPQWLLMAMGEGLPCY